jgi:hypothetical protein
MNDVALVLPVVAMGVPVVLVPIIMGIRLGRHERELQHAERMKALQLGRTLRIDEPWWTPARISVAIGAGVPICVFFFAWLASGHEHFQTPIWLSAGLVGVSAVVGGTTLAHRNLSRAQDGPSTANGHLAKPTFDAEALDVAGYDRY